MQFACVMGALVLALVMVLVATLAVEGLGVTLTFHARHDFKRTIWAEREALRLLRTRYAGGEVSLEEYRRLSYELRGGRPV